MHWDKIFKTIVVQAFKSLAVDFRFYNFNQTSTELDKRIFSLQEELIPNFLFETTVVSYIFKEFVSSPLSNGFYLNQEYKNYLIFQEVPIIKKDTLETSKFIDLVLIRMKYEKDQIMFTNSPVFIQAKNFRNLNKKSDNGKIEVSKYNKTSLVQDVSDLIEMYDSFNCYEVSKKEEILNNLNIVKPFIWIITWDICDTPITIEKIKTSIIESESQLNTFKDKAKDLFKNEHLEFIPVLWGNNSEGNPEIKKWLWIYFAEVYKSESDDGEKKETWSIYSK